MSLISLHILQISLDVELKDRNDNDENADDVDPKLRCNWWVGRGGVMKVDDDQDNDDYPKVMTFQRPDCQG